MIRTHPWQSTCASASSPATWHSCGATLRRGWTSTWATTTSALHCTLLQLKSICLRYALALFPARLLLSSLMFDLTPLCSSVPQSSLGPPSSPPSSPPSCPLLGSHLFPHPPPVLGPIFFLSSSFLGPYPPPIAPPPSPCLTQISCPQRWRKTKLLLHSTPQAITDTRTLCHQLLHRS